MTKQLIIAIGREYGTGGHDIAKELAARFGIQYYDRNILDEIAEEKNIEVKIWKPTTNDQSVCFSPEPSGDTAILQNR